MWWNLFNTEHSCMKSRIRQAIERKTENKSKMTTLLNIMISLIDHFLSYSSFGMFLFAPRHKFNIQWPCPSSMSIDKHPCDFMHAASHVTEARLSLWQKQRLAPLSKQTNLASAAGGHTGSRTGHQPRFSVGVCFLFVRVCVAGEQGVNAAGLWRSSCPQPD